MIRLPDCARFIRDTLAPIGFSLKSSTWHRDMDDFIDIIGFERSKYGETFAVGVGVLTKSVYEKFWGKEIPANPRAMDCTVQKDLTPDPGGGVHWWTFDEASLREAADLVQRLALPFLEEMHSRERQIRFFREDERYPIWSSPIYEAILMFECGAKEEACLKLRNLKSRYGNESLQESTAAIRARLNCPMT